MVVSYGLTKRGCYRKMVECGYTSTKGRGVVKNTSTNPKPVPAPRPPPPPPETAEDKKIRGRLTQQVRFLEFLESKK